MPNPFSWGGKQRRPPNGVMIAKKFTMRLPMALGTIGHFGQQDFEMVVRKSQMKRIPVASP
jgi:hypothetical protein